LVNLVLRSSMIAPAVAQRGQAFDDPLAGLAASEGCGRSRGQAFSGGIRIAPRLDRAEHVLAPGADDAVPAPGDGFRPFRLGPERHARRAEKERFFLQAPRVREDDARIL